MKKFYIYSIAIIVALNAGLLGGAWLIHFIQ